MGAVIAGKSTDQFRPDFDPRRVLPPPPDVPEVEKSTPLLQGFYGHGQYATSDDMGTFRKSPIEDPLRKLESLQCERVLSTDEESIDDLSSLASFDTTKYNSSFYDLLGLCEVCCSPDCDGLTCPGATKPRSTRRYNGRQPTRRYNGRSTALGEQSAAVRALLAQLGASNVAIEGLLAFADANPAIPVEPPIVFDDSEPFRDAEALYLSLNKAFMSTERELSDEDFAYLGRILFLQGFLSVEPTPVRNEKEVLRAFLAKPPVKTKTSVHYDAQESTARVRLNSMLFDAFSEGGAAALVDLDSSIPYRLIAVAASTLCLEDRAVVAYQLAEKRLAALEKASEDCGSRRCICGVEFPDQASAVAHLRTRGPCYGSLILDLIPQDEQYPCRGCDNAYCSRGVENPFLSKRERDRHEQGLSWHGERGEWFCEDRCDNPNCIYRADAAVLHPFTRKQDWMGHGSFYCGVNGFDCGDDNCKKKKGRGYGFTRLIGLKGHVKPKPAKRIAGLRDDEPCRKCGKGPSEVAFKFYIMKGTDNYGLRYSKCVQCLEVQNSKRKREGTYKHSFLEILGAILKNADDNSPIAFNDKVHGIVIRDKTALLGVLEQFDWSKKYESFRVQLSNYGFSFRQVPNLGDAWVNPDVASLDAILAMETTAPKKRKAA